MMRRFMAPTAVRGPARVLSISCLLLLAACGSATNFKKRYQELIPADSPALVSRPTTGEAPRHFEFTAADRDAAIREQLQRGFLIVGHSSFVSQWREPLWAALDQGAAIGADVVGYMKPISAGSTQATIPITTTATSTSYFSGTSGSGTITTYSPTTTFLSSSVNYYEYSAVYFREGRHILGAYLRDLNDAERQRFRTNKGLVVELVVNGQPAYQADLLPGDLIHSVNGSLVTGYTGIGDMIEALRGQTVSFGVRRGDEELTVNVALNP